MAHHCEEFSNAHKNSGHPNSSSIETVGNRRQNKKAKSQGQANIQDAHVRLGVNPMLMATKRAVSRLFSHLSILPADRRQFRVVTRPTSSSV